MLAVLKNWFKSTLLLVPIMLFADSGESCRFERMAGTNREGIYLFNAGAVPGWTVLSNKTQVPIKVANAKNPLYESVIKPYSRRSFNWRGQQEIMCFKGIPDPNHYYTVRYEPVACSAVVDIVKCFPILDPQQGERYKDLQLEG